MKIVKDVFIMIRADKKTREKYLKQARKKGHTLSQYIRLLIENDKTSS